MNTIAEVLRADLEAHNELVTNMLAELCEITGDARRITGGSNTADMTEVDTLGRAPGQKQVAGFECGVPLKMFQYNTGWTERWLQNATVADVAQKQLDAEKAHLRQIVRQIKLAIFDDTNYDFVDLNVDNVTLHVKRFANADGTFIPPSSPDGTAFDATHQHYSGANPWVVANSITAINNVLEHGHTNDPRMGINVAQEAAVRAFLGFSAYVDVRLLQDPTNNDPRKQVSVQGIAANNRPIGLLGGAEVWVKPWVPTGFSFYWDAGDSRKPLMFRQRSAGGALQGLRVAGNFSAHPFGGESMEAEFGVAVWTRTNGAVNATNAGWIDAVIA